MKDILNQIINGLKVNQYYLSLFVALTIPDICGALESNNGNASGKKYKNWFNKYVFSKYNGIITADDCYHFRCSLLHQGITLHPKSNYTRILFIEPGATTNILNLARINGTLTIDVNIFCKDIVDSALVWLKDMESNPFYIENSKKIIKRHPNGFEDIIGGVAVIG